MTTQTRFPILTGIVSRRANGVRRELEQRAASALAASRRATDEREAAALRGKASGLREAVALVRALERGKRIGRRRLSVGGLTPTPNGGQS